MSNLIEILQDLKALLSEGDRGQILIPKLMPVKSDTRGPKLNSNPDPKGVIRKGESAGKKLLKTKKKKIKEETLSEAGHSSKAGERALSSYKGKTHTNPMKSRVRNYNSITDALKRGYMGQVFSTKNADRLYVVTKQKWGKDKEQIINGRSAKGFSQGSIPSKFSDVKKYATRTMQRHGGGSKKIDGKDKK